MPPIFQRVILASAAFVIMALASSTAWADPITITTGNPGNQNTDNVLFNNGSSRPFRTTRAGRFQRLRRGLYR